MNAAAAPSRKLSPMRKSAAAGKSSAPPRKAPGAAARKPATAARKPTAPRKKPAARKPAAPRKSDALPALAVDDPAARGVVHFVGIGGAGMSGIAEVMLNLGYRVRGSDLAESAATRRLRSLGAEIFIGHRKTHARGAGAVVCSSAVGADNVELREAERLHIPLLRRAEMLAELMRFRCGVAVCGTHGKTTTTSLIAALLSEAGLEPTYVIGGRVDRLGGAGLGKGRYLVVEADESDASFLHLNPTLAVVTNIDADHLGAYENDIERLQQAFADFLGNLPFYGVAVACFDDPRVRALAASVPRRFVGYGLGRDCEVRARKVRLADMRSVFEVEAPWRKTPLRLELGLPGRHNVENALAAICAGHCLGVDDDAIARTFAAFSGVRRRFSDCGRIRIGKARARLIDDYAHHPTEIKSALAALAEMWPRARRVLVFQPHRYSRTRALLDRFADALGAADCLLLLDVHAAGEAPAPGGDVDALCDAVRARGKLEPVYVGALDEVGAALAPLLRDGDVVVTMGAGSIGALAPQLKEAFPDDRAP